MFGLQILREQHMSALLFSKINRLLESLPKGGLLNNIY
jgi:hypothetical protein